MTNLPDKWLPLLKAVLAQFKMHPNNSCHGIHHWFRVIDIGLRLAKDNKKVNTDLIIAFGLLHDSARTHDAFCELHGPASGSVILKLQHLIPLETDDIFRLQIACGNHTSASNTSFSCTDETILTCFDADRLDLLRVGVLPESQYLFTDAAKDKNIQLWANDNAKNWSLPSWSIDVLDQLEL